MPDVTIGFGIALVVVGIIGFLPHHAKTALIPAYMGIVLLALGLVARAKPAARKHVMHAAVLVGTLGFLMSAGRLIAAAASGNLPSALGIFSLSSMAILSLAFVVLCVRSFITARRLRQAPPPPPPPSPTS
jgi:hypothetical protein